MGKHALKRSRLTLLQHKAYSCWGHQWDRCHNPKNQHYSYYGAKGIRVTYSRKELIEWLDKWYTGIPIKDIVIGRIDHLKNYSFDNIQLESRRESSHEASNRIKKTRKSICDKRVGLFSKSNNECLAVFKTISECGKLLDANLSAIGKACRHPRQKGSTKYSWLYRFIDEYTNAIVL